MRFVLTMNVPTRGAKNRDRNHHMQEENDGPNLVHLVYCEHASGSLAEFVAALRENDFVIVTELHKDRITKSINPEGEMAINYRYVAKIKPYMERDNEPSRDFERSGFSYRRTR